MTTSNGVNFAIILAAGQSKRMKGLNKLFFNIKGKPLVFYAIRTFNNHPQIDEIILVTRKSEIKKFSSFLKKYKFKKASKIIIGGKERQDSAFAGLNSLKAKRNDLVLFHNGANPLASKEDITAAIKAAKKHGAAAVGQIAKDTIKEVNKKGFVIRTLDRKRVFLAQTPQIIKYSLAKKAFRQAYAKKYKGTDDVSLTERLKVPVKMIPCSVKNIKITTKEDLRFVLNQS